MQGLLPCIKGIMLPSVFEKQKMWTNRTKSLLVLSFPILTSIPILSAIS